MLIPPHHSPPPVRRRVLRVQMPRTGFSSWSAVTLAVTLTITVAAVVVAVVVAQCVAQCAGRSARERFQDENACPALTSRMREMVAPMREMQTVVATEHTNFQEMVDKAKANTNTDGAPEPFYAPLDCDHHGPYLDTQVDAYATYASLRTTVNDGADTAREAEEQRAKSKEAVEAGAKAMDDATAAQDKRNDKMRASAGITTDDVMQV